MKIDRKYIAQFETTEQISPDDFRVERPALEVDEETTIGEIRAWIIKYKRIQPAHEEIWKMFVEIRQIHTKS